MIPSIAALNRAVNLLQREQDEALIASKQMEKFDLYEFRDKYVNQWRDLGQVKEMLLKQVIVRTIKEKKRKKK